MLCGAPDPIRCFLLYQHRRVSFPNDEAARIAVAEVEKFLEKHERDFDRILFNVFKDADRELYEKLV